MVYSFDTSDLQEDALTYRREKENAARAALTPPQPPHEDNAAYVAAFVADVILAPLIVEYVEVRVQRVANAYRVANDAARKTVDGALRV